MLITETTHFSQISKQAQKMMQAKTGSKLLTEAEWRHLGVQQSRGWVHYEIHK